MIRGDSSLVPPEQITNIYTSFMDVFLEYVAVLYIWLRKVLTNPEYIVFHRLFESRNTSQYTKFNRCIRILEFLTNCNENFGIDIFEQQDPHEFIMLLFQNLPPLFPQTFTFSLTSQFTCCALVQSRMESPDYLQLQFPSEASRSSFPLKELISNYFNATRACSVCKINKEPKSFTTLPQILCCQILRFSQIEPKQPKQTVPQFKKNHSVVVPAKTLSAKGDLHYQGPENDATYELKSFVVHHGNNISSGHYISYILVNGTWFCCDDECASTLDTYVGGEPNPYLLFYVKVS